MDYDALDHLAARLMAKRKPHAQRERGSIYFHGQRVSKGVIQLRKLVTSDNSHDPYLRVAGLFHDVGKGMEPHAHIGAVLMKELLKPYMAADEVDEVVRLIGAHDDRKPDSNKHDLPTKLLQDADLLDHYGTSEIWMCFSYYATHERGVSEALDFYRNDYKKTVNRQRKLLNFEESRRIFEEKYRFQRDFIKRLKVEAEGGYMPTKDMIEPELYD
ncbi:MAG: HD domain-containing protein [Clostridia bacterium]|nr:HD domain-containing protein [Clostridia bacterium]